MKKNYMIIIIIFNQETLSPGCFQRGHENRGYKKIASMSAGEANKNKGKTIKSHKKFPALKT